MGNSYINVNIHIIFHIKSTGSIMREEDLPEIFRYIGGLIRELSGYAYQVGGRPDHIHILTSLPVTITLSDLVRAIKSNTSRWLKTLHPCYRTVSWQEGYGAFSVSASNKQAVIDYISNQKEHHNKLSTQEEFMVFLKKHGLQLNPRVENQDNG
ncbi:MAG: IS200/IS605 family transposase [Akkermansia sp.]|nr:IS200/IS605 family transposase [Akkermansia sp.]